MRMLPREVDPLVYNMSLEDPGQVSFGGIGGLNEQIRELREVIELPLKNPELFLRVGIKPPKGVLLYGPPGTGKTLLARAVASSLETNFLKGEFCFVGSPSIHVTDRFTVVSSAIVDKYIGESARLIREMFGYAKEHEPCIIFMDEIDAIGGRRFSEGTSADREIQRTLMELLNQLDGFDYLGKTKIIMATNRPDTLDPALLRAGRLDRKIEIPLPNEVGRLEIMKIHAAGAVTEGDIDFESVVKMSDGLNGADLRNVVTEAYVFHLGVLHTVADSIIVVSSQLESTVMRLIKTTSTKQSAKWRNRRSWRVNWSTKSSNLMRYLFLASAPWHIEVDHSLVTVTIQPEMHRSSLEGLDMVVILPTYDYPSSLSRIITFYRPSQSKCIRDHHPTHLPISEYLISVYFHLPFLKFTSRSHLLTKLLTTGILLPPYSTIPINPASPPSSPYQRRAHQYIANTITARANAATKAQIPIPTSKGADTEVFSEVAETAAATPGLLDEDVATAACAV